MVPRRHRSQELLSRLPVGPVVGAEIGILRGYMSKALLSRNDLVLFMVDNWKEIPDLEHKDIALKQTDFAADRRHVLHLDSVAAASTIQDGTLDFVFIDADHSYRGVSSDIEAWLPKLRRNGLLCGHDYNNKNIEEGVDVKRAVDEFVSSHGGILDCGSDSTWFMRMQ